MKTGRAKLRMLATVAGIAIMLCVGGGFFYVRLRPRPAISHNPDVPIYTVATLREHDGTNNLPIYVALDGYVYDVTPGREFYAPGGTYHAIAGTDASRALHIFGGDIIRQKYAVVGIFQP